jgi:hypothetical protein
MLAGLLPFQFCAAGVGHWIACALSFGSPRLLILPRSRST